MKGFITVTNTNGKKALIYAPNYEFTENCYTMGCDIVCMHQEGLYYNIVENLEEVKDLIKKSHKQ
jgi:2-keto-3-deoxy-L-rhamnonate aldolase RhmA